MNNRAKNLYILYDIYIYHVIIDRYVLLNMITIKIRRNKILKIDKNNTKYPTK
jgi:hypothetical protein